MTKACPLLRRRTLCVLLLCKTYARTPQHSAYVFIVWLVGKETPVFVKAGGISEASVCEAYIFVPTGYSWFGFSCWLYTAASLNTSNVPIQAWCVRRWSPRIVHCILDGNLVCVLLHRPVSVTHRLRVKVCGSGGTTQNGYAASTWREIPSFRSTGTICMYPAGFPDLTREKTGGASYGSGCVICLQSIWRMCSTIGKYLMKLIKCQRCKVMVGFYSRLSSGNGRLYFSPVLSCTTFICKKRMCSSVGISRKFSANPPSHSTNAFIMRKSTNHVTNSSDPEL